MPSGRSKEITRKWNTDNANLLGKKLNTVRKNTEAVLEASRETGLEVNTTEKLCKYLSSVPRMQRKIIT
jgi:hypothetical protein